MFNGLDNIYPDENKKLAKRIEENGTLITEYVMGTKPDAGNFPRRNRIISGISLGTIVVEAGSKSGAMITAFQSLDQNREVFAVPGEITNPKSKGVNRLIKHGAKLIQSADDVLGELKGQTDGISESTNQTELELDLPRSEEKVISVLNKDPMHIDEIASVSNGSISDVLGILLLLELKGLVVQLAGKMFVKA